MAYAKLCYFFILASLLPQVFGAHKNKNSHALLEASKEGDTEKVVKLLQHGANVNFTRHNPMRGDETPLRLAIENDHVEVFRILLKNGAEVVHLPRNTTVYNLDPLSYAAKHGQNDLVEAILEKGVSIEREGSLFCGTALQTAAQYSTLPMVQLLVAKGADLKNKDWNGNTVIHFAMMNPDKTILQFFLEQGLRVDTPKKPKYSSLNKKPELSPFELAVTKGEVDNVATALKHCKKIKKSVLEQALFFLPEEEDTAISFIQLLKDHVSLESKNAFGGTPLIFYAGTREAPELIRTLIQLGAKEGAKDHDGGTPLLHSLASSKFANAKVLMENKKNLLEKTHDHLSVLHMAAKQDDDEILGYTLLALQNKKILAKLINSKDSDGYTPLHIAATYGHRVHIQLLIRYGASLTKRTHQRESLLHVAQHKKEMIILLKEKGLLESLINKKDSSGNTVLHLACKEGDSLLVEKLLKEKANHSLVNIALEKPYHLFRKNMTYSEEVESFESLLAKKLKARFVKEKPKDLKEEKS